MGSTCTPESWTALRPTALQVGDITLLVEMWATHSPELIMVKLSLTLMSILICNNNLLASKASYND